jgi:hypothetical protein
MWIRVAALAATFGSPLAAGDAPLSAIPWLSDSVAAAPPAGDPITVRRLPQPARAVGAIAPADAGIPADLWAGSSAGDLVRLLDAMPTAMPPGPADLLARLLAVRAPVADPDGEFLRARLDMLMAMGRLDVARDVIADAGTLDDALFRRAFDIALLTGTEDAACRQFEGRPDLSPTYPARVFCLARLGDWQAAALTLETAEALGALSAEESDLLGRFLEDGEGELLPPPRRRGTVTPLAFRLFEAIGEALSTRGLPLAFAHADLRPQNGWKTRLEAAERLFRAGAIPSADLLAIYRENAPAASGGVWDRAAAVQAWDDATPETRETLRAAAQDALRQAGIDRLLDDPPADGRSQAIPRGGEDRPVAEVSGPRGEAALAAIVRIARVWDGERDDLEAAVAALRATGVFDVPPAMSRRAQR